MLEKLKELENMEVYDIKELKTALLAYDLGLTSDEISIMEIDAVEEAIQVYYDNDAILSFINPEIIEQYNVSE